MRFDVNTPLSTTISEIRQLYNRGIYNMGGSIDPDKMLTVFLINALGNQFGHLVTCNRR
jgi:hypothetical protein